MKKGCDRRGMLPLLEFSFLAGVFTAISPYILPILGAILTAGIRAGELRPLGTICGLIGSFCLSTLTLSWIVHTTGLPPNIFRYIAIALFFFFGLIMILPGLSDWFVKITSPMKKVGGAKQQQGFWGGVVLGVALGLIWIPYAGPILGGITVFAISGAPNLTTVATTLSYGIGAGILMLLYAYVSSHLLSSSRLLSRFLSHYTEGIRVFSGALMLIFALILLLNWDSLINEKLSHLFPEIFPGTTKN